MKRVSVLLFILFVSSGFIFIEDGAAKTRRAKKPKATPSLRASPDSLARQNEVIDRYGLPRINNAKEMERYTTQCFFVKVESPYLDVVDKIGGYAILPTRDFLLLFGEEFYRAFHKKFKVTWILRPCDFQEELLKNHETIADCATPGKQSAHLTGAALDISRLPMTPREIRWVRKKLAAYKKAGKIEAIEEMWNNTFHIMVCPNWQTGRCF